MSDRTDRLIAEAERELGGVISSGTDGPYTRAWRFGAIRAALALASAIDNLADATRTRED